MTEKLTPERSAFLLADASRILRRTLLAWPETLQPGELAALLAGAGKGEQFREWDYQIMRAIEAGHLTVRTETQETVKQGRTIDTGNRTAFAGMAARVVFHEPAKKVIHTLRHIAPEVAAAWFHAVRMSPCDTVRAWLGPAWQDGAEQKGAGKTAPPETPLRLKLHQLIKDAGLNPADMPGEKIDFHALAAAWEKDFRRMALSTFAGHIKGRGPLKPLCTFKAGRGRDHEAYRVRCGAIGVKVEDYDRITCDLEKQAESAKKAKANRGS